MKQLVTLISIFFSFYSFADVPSGSLSLDEAMQSALERSPGLDQQRAQTELTQWQHTEALSGFLPTLSVSGQYLFDIQVPTFEASFGQFAINSVPPVSPSLDATVILKVPVFDGFKNVNKYQATNQLSRASSLDFDYDTFSLRQQVKLAYYGVVEAQLLSQVADQDVKDLEDHQRLVEDQLKAGVVKRVDLLRVQTQLSNAVSEKTNADDQIVINRQQLAQLLGAQDENRQINAPLPVPQDQINTAIRSSQLNSRPDIDALQLRSEAEVNSHSADAKWWVPSISLLGEAAAFRSDEIKLTTYAFGLSMSWNIFDGLASYSRSKESLAQERIATRGEESSRLQAKTDFLTYQRRYQYNLQKYRARTDDVERSQESVRLTKSGFRAGVQTNTDVLDAEQDLFNARASQIQAQYGAFESLIRFELAVGRNVSP